MISIRWLSRGKQKPKNNCGISCLIHLARQSQLESEVCLRPESAFWLFTIDRQRPLPRLQARERNSTTHSMYYGTGGGGRGVTKWSLGSKSHKEQQSSVLGLKSHRVSARRRRLGG